jgi:hypothetical protein
MLSLLFPSDLHLTLDYMTWYDTITSVPVLLAGALGISAAVYASRGHTSAQAVEQVKEVAQSTRAEGTKGKMAQAVSDSSALRSMLINCIVRLNHVPTLGNPSSS